MFKGFYNLTSGMLSQSRRLDIIANNMTNISTPGFKSEHYTDTTFRDVMISRVGNLDKGNLQELGNQSYILAPDELYTDFAQSSLEQTGLSLDFAIQGEGFFAVQTNNNNQIGYTRSGSFTLDNEGYLCLNGLGRVLSDQGEPIQLPTDLINADETGALFTSDVQQGFLGRIGVYAFPDNQQLERNENGLFVGNGAQLNTEAVIHHRTIERSNVNMIQEMISMMSAQRALQSAAQMSRIYDQIITKATTDLGRP